MRRRSPDATEPLWRRLGSRDAAVAKAAMDELAAMTPEEAIEAVRPVSAHARWSVERYVDAITVSMLGGVVLGYAVAGLWLSMVGAPLAWLLAIPFAALGFLTAIMLVCAVRTAHATITVPGRSLGRIATLVARRSSPASLRGQLDALKWRVILPTQSGEDLLQALLRCLRRCDEKAFDALGPVERDALLGLLVEQCAFLASSSGSLAPGVNGTPRATYTVPLALAILRAYETLTDPRALTAIEDAIVREDELDRRKRSTDASRTVADACRALLPDLRARVDAQRRGETLLRPASADGDTLLRPAATDSAELLRPSQDTDDAQVEQH